MSAIKKSYPVMSQIAEIESLPPFPLLSNIIKSFLVADNEGDLRPLVSNIETEPSIAAKVIGVANSAYFGGSFPIYSLKDAVARLGIIQLKSIVFSIVLSQRFNTKLCPAFDVPRYWYDAMMVAYCASYVAQHARKKRIDHNQMYCLGLLLNIGVLALVYVAPQEMCSVFSDRIDEPLSMRERDVLEGVDHLDAGAALLRQWRLPRDYYESIESMKGPAQDDSDFTLILRRAKELLDSNFQSSNVDIDTRLGLDEESIESIRDSCENDKSWIYSFAAHL
jgi:HD-like signal output (HDOD) protein